MPQDVRASLIFYQLQFTAQAGLKILALKEDIAARLPTIDSPRRRIKTPGQRVAETLLVIYEASSRSA